MSAARSRLGLAVLVCAALASAGCSRIRDHKGYVADSSLIGTVAPGVDNEESVAKTLGRPSFVGEFDKKTWYYVSRDTRSLAFASARPVAQTVLVVHFDPSGTVSKVERTGLEKVASISPNGDKTPTLGRNRGFFRELFGNIGRVGASGAAAPTADNPDGN